MNELFKQSMPSETVVLPPVGPLDLTRLTKAAGAPTSARSEPPSYAIDQASHDELDKVFAKASDLFAVLATPTRLKIMHFLCDGERTVNAVTEFLASSTQANISQHLAVMHRSGILGRRREGTSTYYWIVSEQAVAVCRSVCTQIAIEMED
jgi:DNA-binding transcriptional ArsR family regulator